MLLALIVFLYVTSFSNCFSFFFCHKECLQSGGTSFSSSYPFTLTLGTKHTSSCVTILSAGSSCWWRKKRSIIFTTIIILQPHTEIITTIYNNQKHETNSNVFFSSTAVGCWTPMEREWRLGLCAIQTQCSFADDECKKLGYHHFRIGWTWF